MKARKVKKLDPAAPLSENAARIVRVRLDELRSFAPAALVPENERQQHDMRIAAKRLRYILEATEFCFGKPGVSARRRARDLQDLLGELHDCDVILPRIETHLSELRASDAATMLERAAGAPDLDPRLTARAPHRTAYRGLEVLAVHVQARRQLLFDRFRAYWAEQEKTGTWRRLERAARKEIEEGRDRRRATERTERAADELAEAERAEHAAAERAHEAAAELQQARREARRPTPASGS